MAARRSIIAGSRAAGAVMIAPSSAVSIGEDSALGRQALGEEADQIGRRGGVGAQHLQHVADLDVDVAPAVVVGDHGHAGVGQLRLAGELGLGHGGHADHVAAPRPVERALGPGGELRALDGDVGPALDHRRAGRAGRRRRRSGRAARQTGSAMETWAARPGPKKLGSRAKVRSMNWSTTTRVPGASASRSEPDRGDREDVGAAGALQRVDVGAGVDGARRQRMAAAVARQEDQAHAAELADKAARRRARRTGCRRASSGRWPGPRSP